MGSETGYSPGYVWLDAHKASIGAAEVPLARQALARVMAGSELAELWQEGHGDDNEWARYAKALMVRLLAVVSITHAR